MIRPNRYDGTSMVFILCVVEESLVLSIYGITVTGEHKITLLCSKIMFMHSCFYTNVCKMFNSIGIVLSNLVKS